jgi:uracil-DNA glycosylase
MTDALSSRVVPGGAAGALMTEIIGCPHVAVARTDRAHPCSGVVSAQQGRQVFQHPEPWSGDLESAPLLFVGSNPGLGDDVYPEGQEFGDRERNLFFANRLSPPITTRGGTYLMQKTGQAKRQPTYVGLRAYAEQLFGAADVKAGKHYVVTEVVHCKSSRENNKGEKVVKAAASHCADLYMTRILSLSPATLVIVFGAEARTALLLLKVNAPQRVHVWGPLDIAGRSRMVAHLHHPAFGKYGGLGTVEQQLGTQGAGRVRAWLGESRRGF